MSDYLEEITVNWTITYDNLNAAILAGDVDAIEKWTAEINHIESIHKEYNLEMEL